MWDQLKHYEHASAEEPRLAGLRAGPRPLGAWCSACVPTNGAFLYTWKRLTRCITLHLPGIPTLTTHHTPAHTHLKTAVTLLVVVSHSRNTDEDDHQHHHHQHDALRPSSSAAATTLNSGGAGVEGSEFGVRARDQSSRNTESLPSLIPCTCLGCLEG